MARTPYDPNNAPPARTLDQLSRGSFPIPASPWAQELKNDLMFGRPGMIPEGGSTPVPFENLQGPVYFHKAFHLQT
jgi:hypothetical protein